MKKKSEIKNVPDEEVVLKMSVCNKCNDVVRTAVQHMMTTKSKNEFMREVLKYNLSVKEMSLLDYRKEIPKFCKCKE